jgi:hypothetical protein
MRAFKLGFSNGATHVSTTAVFLESLASRACKTADCFNFSCNQLQSGCTLAFVVASVAGGLAVKGFVVGVSVVVVVIIKLDIHPCKSKLF